MTATPAPAQDDTLAKLTERCVRSALPALKLAINSGAKPKNNSSFARIERGEDGARALSKADPVPDYGSILEEASVASSGQVAYEDLDGYAALVAYVRSVPEYFEHLSGGETMRQGTWSERFFTFRASQFIGRLVDRHIHIAGWNFDSAFFSANYVLLERGLLGKSADGRALTVDILVPLYGVTFDAEKHDGPAQIEVLMDELLAACWPGTSLEKYDEQLLLKATHVWVQPTVPITIDPVSGFLTPTGLDLTGLDRLLEIVSVSAMAFGTKHVLYRPNNWTEWWIGDLPPAGRWAWTYERSTVGLKRLAEQTDPSALSLEQTQRRFRTLTTVPHQVQLAARRLFSAACRSDPLDAVVDACIGIEALVGDDSPTEVTHKLALRTAAVLTHVRGSEPEPMFTTVKNLYARRSKIVHGKLKAKDNNTVKAFGDTFSANAIGAVVLSALLEAILDHPDLIGRIANDDLVLSLLGPRRLDASGVDETAGEA